MVRWRNPGLGSCLLGGLAVLSAACAGTAPSPATPEAAGLPTPPAAATAELPVIDVPQLEERALLLLISDRRLYEPVAVIGALEGPAELRVELAMALGRIGDPRGLGDLEGLLADESVEVRRAAAFALGELGDPAAVPVLRLAAADADRETGVLAVEALGKLGMPVATAEAALAGLPEPERRARLLPHLFRFDPAERRPLAAAALALDDPELHARAAYALARDAVPEAVPALRSLLADPDPWVRGWAARALGSVGDGSDLPRLEPLLDDPEPGPVVHALAAGRRLIETGRAAAPDSWRPRLAALLADSRPHLRLAALDAASAWLLDAELGTELAARAAGTGGEEPWERGAALLALARAGDPRAADLAAAAATAADPLLRARAAEAAALAAGPPTAGARSPAGGAWAGPEPLLERLLSDPEPLVRVAALEAAAAVGGDAAAGLVAELLARDTDAGVRAAALGWAAEHPLVPLEDLGQAAVFALADRNVESSLNAVRALAARAEAEPLDRGTCVQLLEQLAGVREYPVRVAAASALEALGRPRPPVGAVDSGLDLDAYRQVVQRTRRPRTVAIATSAGALTVRLDCPRSPLTCLNFLNLAGQGFYEGLTFHRVVPDFVVQGGDPRGDGWGGPGYAVRDEIGTLRYRRGVVGMALAGADTGGSQFFVTLSPQPHLDGGYTAFGEVVAGGEVLERIVPGTRIESVREVAGR